ncbi:MAG: flagellar assembly protein FliW [Clostridium sp.]
MKLKTKFFDEIEINENTILNFQNGIPGFEGYKQYALLDFEEKKIKCLQCIDNVNICLILISPWDYNDTYEINISDDEINNLDIKDQKQVLVFNIVTVRENKITANFVAPIIINVLNNKAMQIVLNNNNYNIREVIECLY